MIAGTAIYDGTAYYGEHAAQTWLQREEAAGAPAGGSEDGMRVLFTTGPMASADDKLVELCQELGGEARTAVVLAGGMQKLMPTRDRKIQPISTQ